MRLNRLSTTISICFLLLVIALAYTQIARKNYYQRLSENNRIRLLPRPGRRGVIYDCKGRVLAEDRLSFNLCVIPQEVQSQTIVGLSKILGLSREEIEETLRENIIAPFAPTIITRDIDYDLMSVIEERSIDLPGVIIDTQPVRYCPYGSVGAHIIGYLGKINPDELEVRKRYGYRMRDLIGRDGLEKFFDAFLKGKEGGQLVEIDYKGRIQRILSHKLPLKGNDLYLTVDIELEKLAYGLLEEECGVIIVMDPATGAILAMASSPAYDPNIFVDPGKNKERLAVLKDASCPLLNRAVNSQYPPGSIFKIISALAALEMKKTVSSTRKYCDGKYKLGRRIFRCWKGDGHGWLNLEEAIMHSCNIYFYQIGLSVGADNLARFAKYFGLGSRTGIELPGEVKGLVPTTRWKRLTYGQPWYKGETLNLSIGQGYLSISPLQAVRMISAVANNGILPSPHLVKQSPRVKKVRRINISDKNLTIVKRGMFKGVNHPEGTSHRVYLPGISIAAKTGTAQVKSGRSPSWFLGFCPKGERRIAFVVFLEHGGYGSQRAAEIARELIKGWKEISQHDS